MSNAIDIYRHALSGHAHRVQLFASLTGIAHNLIDVDLLAGEHKSDEFLAKNPNGKVPVVIDGDAIINDSNAILVYLARKYAPEWLPTDALQEAEVQEVLSFAANEIANGPAAARLNTVFGANLDEERSAATAAAVLGWLENRLSDREWLVAGRPTIADVAVYTYVAHAPEGNISLDPYPNIRALLARTEALPGFVGMQKTAVGLAV